MNRQQVTTAARLAAALSADAEPAQPDADLLRRFAADGDEAAFALLVHRHGPMVWAACWQLLPNPADAEDAFQATFLALARSAARVRSAAALGGWLHGVAVRASLKVRRSEARRRTREHAAAGPEGGRPVPDSAWDDLLAAVHEEVQRLPDGLRTAFVLCDLEGVSQPDAATRLGWKPGTLTGRLTRARQRLLVQLTKRGLAPAAAATIGAASAGAGVPAELTGRVLALAADPGGASAAVLELVREATAMTWNRTKLLAASLMVAGGLGVGGVAVRMAEGQAPAAKEPTPTAKPAEPAAASPLVPAPAPGRVTWEYRYAKRPDSAVEWIKLLDEFGVDGWEYMDYSFQMVGRDDTLKDMAKANPGKFHMLTEKDAFGLDPKEIVVFKRQRLAMNAVETKQSSNANPPSPPSALIGQKDNDLKRLQGRWKVRDQRVGDEFLNSNGLGFMKFTWVIKGDQIEILHEPGQGADGTGKLIKLDPNKDPKQIDFRAADMDRIGIYSIDGDQLQICFSTVLPVREELRPTDFTTPPGSGRVLFVFERVKE